jgi:hypothetical protein
MGIDDFLYSFIVLRHSKIFHGGNERTKKLAAETGYPEWLIDRAYELGWTECMDSLMKEWEKHNA